MENPTETLLAELAQEQKELRLRSILTGLAGVGLLAGVMFQYMGMSLALCLVTFGVVYIAGGMRAAFEPASRGSGMGFVCNSSTHRRWRARRHRMLPIVHYKLRRRLRCRIGQTTRRGIRLGDSYT